MYGEIYTSLKILEGIETAYNPSFQLHVFKGDVSTASKASLVKVLTEVTYIITDDGEEVGGILFGKEGEDMTHVFSNHNHTLQPMEMKKVHSGRPNDLTPEYLVTRQFYTYRQIASMLSKSINEDLLNEFGISKTGMNRAGAFLNSSVGTFKKNSSDYQHTITYKLTVRLEIGSTDFKQFFKDIYNHRPDVMGGMMSEHMEVPKGSRYDRLRYVKFSNNLTLKDKFLKG